MTFREENLQWIQKFAELKNGQDDLAMRAEALKAKFEGSDDFLDLKRREEKMKVEVEIQNRDFQAFLRKHGLSENFTFPDLIALSIQKANET